MIQITMTNLAPRDNIMTDTNNNNDAINATFLADATPFLRVLAQILHRLLTQLDSQSSPRNNGNRQETVIEGE